MRTKSSCIAGGVTPARIRRYDEIEMLQRSRSLHHGDNAGGNNANGFDNAHGFDNVIGINEDKSEATPPSLSPTLRWMG